jgi:hypothetical protein
VFLSFQKAKILLSLLFLFSFSYTKQYIKSILFLTSFSLLTLSLTYFSLLNFSSKPNTPLVQNTCLEIWYVISYLILKRNLSHFIYIYMGGGGTNISISKSTVTKITNLRTHDLVDHSLNEHDCCFFLALNHSQNKLLIESYLSHYQ